MCKIIMGETSVRVNRDVNYRRLGELRDITLLTDDHIVKYGYGFSSSHVQRTVRPYKEG